jgi:hypothetical protein
MNFMIFYDRQGSRPKPTGILPISGTTVKNGGVLPS